MSDDTGHRTATIPRPRPALPPSRARRDDVRRGDADAKLISRRRWRVALALLAAVVAGSLAASVLILPVKAWLNQRDELSTREQELAQLNEQNTQLQAEVDRLNTDQGVVQEIREELGAVREDEKVYRVVMDPPLIGDLPQGWLYPTIAVLMAQRAGGVATPATGSVTPPATEPAAQPEATGG